MELEQAISRLVETGYSSLKAHFLLKRALELAGVRSPDALLEHARYLSEQEIIEFYGEQVAPVVLILRDDEGGAGVREPRVPHLPLAGYALALDPPG